VAFYTSNPGRVFQEKTTGFIMNKVALGFFIAATVGCSASAFAATNGEGQINFTGEIIDSACQVVNGLGNPLNVPLGKISKTVFTGAGSTSTMTKFDIELKDCPETVTSAAINFGGTPDANNNTTLALTPDADAATGVAIQLVDSAQHPVSLYTPSQQYPLTAGSTVNDLEFGARYIQTEAAVTAGLANSVSTFTVIYN
jgi:major type 1 subunit fimbrin (pilin)